jgi:YggT family protein
MTALIVFVFIILHYLIQAVIWIVIANAIISWLIAFDVINMRNRTVNQIVRFLDAITRPILQPLRRVIPTLGGIDITPVILIIVLQAADVALLPALAHWLIGLTGGGAVVVG